MFSARIIHECPGSSWIVLIHGLGGNADTWKNQEKAYGQHYNLLLLSMHDNEETLSLEKICRRIIASMDHYSITQAHFVSISSGTMVALHFLARYPERVISMVMAGGIIKFNFRTKTLLALAHAFRKTIPYMQLYRFFAYIIMPRRNHRKSREIFVREARKMGKAEFCKWIEIIPELYDTAPLIKTINTWNKQKTEGKNIRVRYILGSQDHLFHADTKRLHKTIHGAEFREIANCGHVCTIEQHEAFTDLSLEFMNERN